MPLEGEALREIELSVHGKLRAHHLSESFIERYSEDAVQRGVAEYLSARSRGVAVEHRDAFIVDVAFKRAMDELRREARHSRQAAIEVIADSRLAAAPPTEELAIEALQVEQMRQAIGDLSPEDRQLLSLFYFEERSATEIAALLHLSERSFRRRLRRAIARLGWKLGVEPPEPGSTLAIEIGVLSWVSLGGAQVPVVRGLFDQISSAFDGAHQWVGRLFASGDGERFSALASGPAGKVASGCAGAAIVCVLGGVVGPGVHGISGDDPGGNSAHRSQTQPVANRGDSRVAAPRAAQPEPLSPILTTRSSPQNPATESPARRRAAARKAEKKRVEAQASGIARVTEESSAPRSEATESSSEPAEPEAVVIPPPSSSPSESEAAQAEQEFGAFK
ncbi:MAG TPA: sigma-70 family RNA polymerase sigma factor [Solirubrobacterales bacterium]|nr:sigma-70 family RNA polymerase sigma factor [Solirubrobacterales bacterium]